MDNSSKINFLNNDSKIYNITISELTFYFLVLNIKEKSAMDLIDVLSQQGKKLVTEKIDEDSFFIPTLNEELGKCTDTNKDLICELITQNYWSTYACLVNYKGDHLITYDIKGLIESEEPNVRVLAVFLSQKETEQLHEKLLNEKVLEVHEFKEVEEIDRISSLFFEDDVKIESKNDEEELEEEQEEDEEKYIKEQDDEIKTENEIESKKNKHKKRRKHRDEDGDFDQEEIKERKKSRKRRREEDDSLYQDEVTVFLSKLREAVVCDKKSFKKKTPALEKLKLLPYIQNFLANIAYQRLFLQNNGLELLQEWIRRNRDGTYPALNQLHQMLDILANLSITLQHLKSCQIGGYVMDLSKNMKESKSIQNKARELVEKWSRIVWEINTNYSDIDAENNNYELIYKKNKRSRTEEYDEEFKSKENIDSNPLESRNENDLYSHAKIPKKGLFDFTRKPEPSIIETKSEELIKVRYNFFDNKKKGGRKKNE